MYNDHFDGEKLIEEEDDGFSQSRIPNCSSFSMAENPLAAHMEMDHYCYNSSNRAVNYSNCNGENQYQIYIAGSFPETPYPDLHPLPRCSSNNPPNLLASLPVCDPFSPSSSSSLLRGLYEYHSLPKLDQGLINQDGDGVSGEKSIGKDDVKHSASERQKRKDFNAKYQALKDLIPNPSKEDRASIVGDTIEYINELKGRVSELKNVVEKKRRARDTDEEKDTIDDWVRRRSRNAEVDVRIMENDVSMKVVVLVQHRRINCLLFVAKALDELHIDLHNVSGGAIGDFYTYFINSKICLGSNVHASAVANKVIQAVDQLYTSN